MPRLHDVQTAFAAALLSGESCRLSLAVAPTALGAERRIQVYRNHFAISLTECLGATFPTLKTLVGEAYFNQHTRRFAEAFPPSSPVLFEYGETFPGYLASATASDEFAYLADMGAFEWAINCAYHADDATAIVAHEFLSIPDARRDALVLRLHPSARLVASAYPILDIWRASRPGSPDDTVDLGRGGIRLLVWRNGIDVGWRELAAAEATFAAALMACAPLAQACAAAVAEDPDFRPGAMLADLIAGALLTGFTLPPEPSER